MIKPPFPVLPATERDGQSRMAKFHHLQPNPRFTDRTVSSSSTSVSTISAFSDCNSDRSTDFSSPSPSSSSAAPSPHRLVPAYSDDRVRALVSDLDSDDPEAQIAAVTELRLLAKDNPDNRVRIAHAGAVLPLVGLLSSDNPYVVEQAVTAVLNLSLCEENRNLIARAGAIRPLVHALRPRAGTSQACRENAALALTRLSQVDEHRAAIGRAGAVPLLVALLEAATTPRGKKDALTAIYALCGGSSSSSENRVQAARAGVVRPLLELMAEPESGMVDKAAYVLATVAGIAEAQKDIVEESGVPVLVELIESGTCRQKDVATDVLFQVCRENPECRILAAREQAVPALVALKESPTTKARKKAEVLVGLLRQPRPMVNGVTAERRRRESDKAAASARDFSSSSY